MARGATTVGLGYLRLAAPLAVGVCRPAHAVSLLAASVEPNQLFQPLAVAAGLAMVFAIGLFLWSREAKHPSRVRPRGV